MKGVIIDVDLYAKIRHMYVQQKMSQRAIAKALGISRNTVKSIARVNMFLGKDSLIIGSTCCYKGSA